MNHQLEFRLWLSVVCIAAAGFTFFSTGKAQDVVPLGQPGQVVVNPGQFSNQLRPAKPANTTYDPGGGEPTALNHPAGPSAQFGRPANGNNPYGSTGPAGGTTTSDRLQRNSEKLQQVLEELKRADSDDAREAADERLSEIVSLIFDDDLKRRESEVSDIQQRASNLQALIQKRMESKDRIVDLQLKIQLNEVEGLGFTVKPSGRKQFESLYPGGMADLGMGSAMGIDPGVRYWQVLGIPGEDMYAGGDAAGAADEPRRQSETALHAATAKLKVANSEQERQAASQLLRSALEDYFAADLAIREREVKGIQERVERLGRLIERRRQARDQVISLQLEVLKNEADGLGFFSTSARRSSNGSGAFHVNVSGMNQSLFGFAR